MCVVKTPKIKKSDEKPPEPTIIRNPYLDGLDPATKALRRGRSSLRIERGGGGSSTTPPSSAPPISNPAPITPPGFPPVMGGGGFGGGFNGSPFGYAFRSLQIR